jgi:3-phosphoshikimate 1-carboxyvinyltransferase
METRLGATGQAIQIFGQEAFGEAGLKNAAAVAATITVSNNTVHAIRKMTIHLVRSILETYLLTPSDIICAFFISDLTADYPARAVREALGWHTVPLLCAQETSPAANGQSSISAILLVNTPCPKTAEQPTLRGIRGATILNESTAEALRSEMRWLLDEILTQNKLDLAQVVRAVVTVTPDLDPASALSTMQEVLGPSISILVASEIDVPGAPKRCIRVLLLVQTAANDMLPVYSEQARRLLRPDLGKPTPHTIRVCPSGPLQGAITPPSSKYHTLRAILAAFLAEGVSTINTPALSDDTAVLLKACAQLGATVQTSYQDDKHCTLHIRGIGGHISPSGPLSIDAGNAGAVLRFLLGICATSPAAITFTTAHQNSLGQRPNEDLLQGLADLGASITRQGPQGTLPITIQRGQLRGGKIRISGKKSSQYLSALLYLGPLLEEGLEVEITDTLTSASFVDLTIEMLHKAGITIITQERYRRYLVPGKQHYSCQIYHIPGDYPSAASLLAAVSVTGGELTLYQLLPKAADGEAMLDAFSQMGLHITRTGTSITASTRGPLRGIQFDGNTAIDSVPCIAAAACFASTPSIIFNIANLRLKECDRIYDLAAALNAAGCQVVPSSDALEIYPSTSVEGNVVVNAHTDHRLIQALAVAGLASKHPITLHGAQHVAKSYPHFFDDLTSLGAKVEIVRNTDNTYVHAFSSQEGR